MERSEKVGRRPTRSCASVHSAHERRPAAAGVDQVAHGDAQGQAEQRDGVGRKAHQFEQRDEGAGQQAIAAFHLLGHQLHAAQFTTPAVAPCRSVRP